MISFKIDPPTEKSIGYLQMRVSKIDQVRKSIHSKKKQSTGILIHSSWSFFETYSFSWLIFETLLFTWSVFHWRDRDVLWVFCVSYCSVCSQYLLISDELISPKEKVFSIWALFSWQFAVMINCVGSVSYFTSFISGDESIYLFILTCTSAYLFVVFR